MRLPIEKEIQIYDDFDNFNTIRYKLSNLLKERGKPQPIEFISLESDPDVKYTYSIIQAIFATIFDLKKEKTTLKEQYNTILEQFPEVDYNDITFIYKETMDMHRKKNKEYIYDGRNLTTPENILIEINDMFLDLSPQNPLSYIKFEELEQNYESWISNNKIKIEQQQIVYKKIIENQKELNEIEKLEHSEFVLQTISYIFSPKIKDIFKEDSYIPSIEEGIEIFKHSIVNPDIPFIRYVDNEGQSKIWIYNQDSNIQYDLFTKSKIKSNSNYIIFWYYYEPNKKYIECHYYIDKAKIFFEFANIKKLLKSIKKAIQKSFPILILDEGSQIRVQGYFDVENVSIDSLSYYYMLRTDSLHRTYLYMEETTNAWADNPNINVLYKDFKKSLDELDAIASIKIAFDNLSSDDKLSNAILIDEEKVKEKNKLRVYVKKAESENEIKKFLFIFCRLLNKYKTEKEDIEKYLKKTISEVVKTKTEMVKTNIKKNAEKKINNLKERAPQLYGVKARICQNPKQPLIISADEVEDWRNYKSRQVMPFPPLPSDDNGKFEDIKDIKPDDERVDYWFVCPDDEFPYPSLIPQDNKEFPYLPCCGKKDTLTELHRSKDQFNNYYIYYESKEQKIEKPVKSGGYQIMSSKILKAFSNNLTGTIGKNLNLLLSSHDKDSDEIFKRYAIIDGTNSFIHCILTAVKDKNYTKLTKDSDRNDYAKSVRQYIANNINPNLFKQELYDYSNQEILSQIKNDEIDFSPEKFYRGLEEVFNINIFVFNPGTVKNKNIDSDDEETLSIEIPRNKLMHIRYSNEKSNTVIIYRHWGADKDKTQFPHCELIISEKIEETEKNKVTSKYNFTFGSSMTKLLYSTLSKSLPNYLWTIEDKKITTRKNAFSQIDWQKAFSDYPIVGQLIDSYGKMRVISLQIKSNKVMYIFIPPSQPLNVDIIKKIEPIEEKLVISIFGQPSGIAENGLWFPAIDFQYCLYVPTIKSGDSRKITPKIPEEPSINLEKDDIKEKIELINLAKRNIYYLIQIIRWLLYSTYKIKDKIFFDDWWEEFFVTDNKVSDIPTNDYHLTTKLPTINSISEGIEIFSKYWPTFFHKDKKIHLYENLYKKLYNFFKKDNEYIAGLSSHLSIKYLKDLYIKESDFYSEKEQQTDSHIFLNLKQYEIWLNEQQRKNSNQLMIFDKADSSHINNSIPYIYKDTNTGKIFIIQNVQGGEFNKVVNLCVHWQQNLVNLGFKCSAYTGNIEDIPYVIYSISKSSIFIPIKDHSNNDLNYHYIIQYSSDDRYAAMLPIL